MRADQEQLDLRFASHLREWRDLKARNRIGADKVIAMIEALWDHTLAVQGRTHSDLSGRVSSFLNPVETK